LVTAFGAWIDLRTGHIPNWLTIGSIALGPILHAAAALASGRTIHAALFSLAFSAAGAAVCALLPAALYARHALGGGDVKLFAAVGALCGPLLGLRAELYSFALGGLYALAIAASHRRLHGVARNLIHLVTLRSAGSQPCPVSGTEENAGELSCAPSPMMAVRFGPAIFAGTVVSIWVVEGERWLSR
jgi:prepilin peptidase CpaA